MMPPLVRRCPECGHVTWSRRFTVVADADGTLVECPSCRRRFESGEDPRLK